MKKLKYYFASAALALSVSSCNFLDLTPQGAENSENYFNALDNAIYAVNGIYDMLQLDEGNGPDGQWVGGHFDFFLGDMTSDDSEKGSDDTDNIGLLRIAGGTAASSLDQAESFWIHGFWGVSRANYCIEGLEGATFDSAMRDRLMGEALFLRAYFNWYLVRMFGPIPLVTASVQPSDFGTVGRSSRIEVYAQVAEELLNAADWLPTRRQYSANDRGRATRAPPQALLVSVNR